VRLQPPMPSPKMGQPKSLCQMLQFLWMNPLTDCSEVGRSLDHFMSLILMICTHIIEYIGVVV
jgi:hypothetical protein